MSEPHRIAQQLRQALSGGAWHGPATMEILAEVDARRAARKLLRSAHSIWEIVLHLMETQKILQRRIAGDETATEADDWFPQPHDRSEEAWQTTIETLRVQEMQLIDLIERFSEQQLDQPLIAGGSSAYNNFLGHVQHNLYHAGQIKLLNKLLLEDQP